MRGRANLRVTQRPKLKRPYMVCGISGWVDAGEAATGTVRYLITKLRARKFAEIPIARFHIFQVPGQLSPRPHISIKDGLLEEHGFPQNEFFYWVNPRADHDVILFLGTEPYLNWEEYNNAILGLAEDFAVVRIYLLGGVLDKIPHTKEPGVSCLCSDPELKDEMQRYGMQFINYEGPGSLGTTLLHMCQNKGVETVSIIAAATYYPEFNIVTQHNPKTIRALMRRLKALLHLDLDLSDLDKQVKEFAGKLSFMVSHNPQLRAYVEKLERDFVEVTYDEPFEISADEAVEIAEEFLKREKDE